MTIDDLCLTSDLDILKPFIAEVWQLKYSEEPNYNKLKFMLVSILLDKNVVPIMNLLDIKEDDEENVNNVFLQNLPDSQLKQIDEKFKDLKVADEHINYVK